MSRIDQPRYMTEDPSIFEREAESRKNLFPPNLPALWREAEPLIERMREEMVLKLLGHEVMADYQAPYMEALAGIATEQGGDVLSVGYGLGLVDKAIERLRTRFKLNDHHIIELNRPLAEEARAAGQGNPHWVVHEGAWEEIIGSYPSRKFRGIVYDGYPLRSEDLHRDGIPFIAAIAERQLLVQGGILTFFVDAIHDFSPAFMIYLKQLGFNRIHLQRIPVRLPKRKMQRHAWGHFLAPRLIFQGS